MIHWKCLKWTLFDQDSLCIFEFLNKISNNKTDVKNKYINVWVHVEAPEWMSR